MGEKLRLRIAIGNYGHTRALKDGQVSIKGADAEFVEVNPIIAAFRKMVRELAYDVCELAPTTFMIARAAGVPIKALPVFLMRRFHHGGIVYRPDSGISVPKDLEGKAVGVRAYSVTTGVWTRGILVDEYGLDSSRVTWVVDDEEHVTSIRLPRNVAHAPEGSSLAAMMAEGRLQAGFTGPAGIGRAGPPKSGWEGIGQPSTDTYPELIPDAAEREAEWFRRTGIYPIHGLIAVKEALLDEHPWLAGSLMDAFTASKKPYLDQLLGGQASDPEAMRYRSLLPLIGQDPLPYGFEANQPAIEALASYAESQAFVPSRPDPRAIYVTA